MGIALIMRGVPGSGKSTFVREIIENLPEFNFQIICKDAIRFAHGVPYGQLNKRLEPFFHSIAHAMMCTYRGMGMNMIFDETNVNNHSIPTITRAINYGQVVEDYAYRIICVSMDIPLERCIKNLVERDKSMRSAFPNQILTKMYAQYEESNETIKNYVNPNTIHQYISITDYEDSWQAAMDELSGIQA